MDRIANSMHGGRIKKLIQATYICTAIIIGLLLVTLLITGLRIVSVQASVVKVGLIVNGDLSEYSYNWLGIQGLLRAESDFGVVGIVYTSTDAADIEPDVMQCASEGNDLCIGVGFLTSGAISNTAPVYTSTKFVSIDGDLVNPYPNLRVTQFASEDVGYLAGTLAGLMSQSNVIGDLGGIEIPPVIAFTESYSNGAKCANSDITTIISYTNSFTDTEVGAHLAQEMIAQGADVVFAAAGASGNSAIITTTQSGVWAIGVDTDQFLSLFMSGTVPGSNYLLTSAMKHIDNGVYNSISDVVSGDFSPGLIIYDLSDGGVGLAPFHQAEEAIPLAVRDRLEWVKRAIIGEAIDPLDPNGPCLTVHKLFLPITTR